MIRFSPQPIRVGAFRPLFFVFFIAIVVPWQAGVSQEVESSRAPAVRPGTVVSRPPQQVSERPVDLARFDQDEIRHGISVSSDRYPDGRGDLPWLKGEAPRYFSPLEFTLSAVGNRDFNAKSTPYWSADLPASVDIDLGRYCYVSKLIVAPAPGRKETLEFHMTIVDDDGKHVNWSPAARAFLSTPEATDRVQRGIPVVVDMRPKKARRLRVVFPKSTRGPKQIHIDEIRILGHPVDDPGLTLRAATDEERVKVAEGSHDLARFTPKEVSKNVRVSDDRSPSGNYMKPWLLAKDKEASPPTDKHYWSTGAPAWVEVTLANPAIVHRVLVQALGEGLGVTAFYVKVVTPEGIELDLYPPAEIQHPPVKAPGTGTKPLPMIVDFEPIHAQRLKFYFTESGFESGLAYIEDIRVFGIEANLE